MNGGPRQDSFKMEVLSYLIALIHTGLASLMIFHGERMIAVVDVEKRDCIALLCRAQVAFTATILLEVT